MAGSTEYSIKIYTNDGSTLLKWFSTYLYSTDPILCWVSDTGMSVDIPETDEHEASVEYYTYSGSKKFLGFATTANSAVITYKIGDGFDAMEEMKLSHVLSLYIVEENPKTTKTFDLSTLNLSAGTHEITVKARASGYADSPASNAVGYAVTGDTVQVSGSWVFNETLSGIDLQEKVSFNCNGKKYEGITTLASEALKPNIGVTYWGTWNADDYVNAYGLRTGVGYAWLKTEYRYIVFYGTQYVSHEFYDWLVANATYGEGN